MADEEDERQYCSGSVTLNELQEKCVFGYSMGAPADESRHRVIIFVVSEHVRLTRNPDILADPETILGLSCSLSSISLSSTP